MAEGSVRPDELQPLGEIQAKQIREYVAKLEKERVDRWENFEEGYTRTLYMTITPEMVIMNTDGVEDFNSWYDGWRSGDNKSPFGPAVVPPLMLAQQCETTHFLITREGRESTGGIHVLSDTEIVSPCLVGTRVKITGKLLKKYEKRDRRYMRFEYTIEDADSGKLYSVEHRENMIAYKKVGAG